MDLDSRRLCLPAEHPQLSNGSMVQCRTADKYTKNTIVFLITRFMILVQAACVLHLWWQTKAKLAIVFTYFLSPEAEILFRPIFLHN